MKNNNITTNLFVPKLIEDFNPNTLSQGIVGRVRICCLELNLT